MARSLNPGLLASVVCLFLLSPVAQSGEPWWETSGEALHYDLSRTKILIVIGEDFDFQETMVISAHWQEWGANVRIAGSAPKLTGHLWKKTKKGWDRSETRTIEPDLLLGDVKLADYDVLFFPGGNSPKNLLAQEGDRVTALVREAARTGKAIAAICHGPAVLAAAGVVSGRRVACHPEIAPDVAEAGGTVANTVCVADGNLVTGNWPYFESLAVEVAERVLFPNGGGPIESSPFVTNPVLKTIAERRSIRRFTDRDVDPAIVRHLLRAATWAPSADNSQPWRFVVVRDRGTKRRILEAMLARLRPEYEREGIPFERAGTFWEGIWSAPVHVFAYAVAQEDEAHPEVAGRWADHAVAAACENMLLGARALGLGSLWIGASLISEEEIGKLLAVPKGARLVTAVALGYPAQEPLPPVRKPLSSVTFREAWGKE